MVCLKVEGVFCFLAVDELGVDEVVDVVDGVDGVGVVGVVDVVELRGELI
jgi:hypothetical protein